MPRYRHTRPRVSMWGRTPVGLGETCPGRAGVVPSVERLLDLVDTTDPAWPQIATALREFAESGGELNESTIDMAVRIGRRRHSDSPVVYASPTQVGLVAGAPSIVYYILRGDLIKIGTTMVPRKRFQALMPTEILGAEPGDRELEAQRHSEFGHLRLRGENFRDTPELRYHIKLVRELYGAPDPTWSTIARAAEHRADRRVPPVTSRETMTVAEVEEQLGIKRMTVYMWIHRGDLPVVGRDQRGRQVVYREHVIWLRDASPRRLGREAQTS